MILVDDTLIDEEILAAVKQLKAVKYSIQWLCFLSYLGPRIPKALWAVDPKFQKPILNQQLASEALLDSVLFSLLNSRLIQYSSFENEYISIQESVQRLMRGLLEGTFCDQAEILQALDVEERSPIYWIKRAIEFVDTIYPTPSCDNLDECEILNPSTLQCIEFGRSHQVKTESFANLLYCMGMYSSERGEYNKAIDLLEETREMQAALYGVDHVNTIPTINQLGMMSSKAKRHDHALECFEHCQRIMKKAFGDGDINSADIIDNVGLMYATTQRHDAAIQRFQKAKSIRLKNLGSNHPKLIDSERNLGDVYFKMGELKFAISHFNEALRISQFNFPREHPITATALENLADIYLTLGNYAAALTLYQSALKIKQCIFGTDRVETADTSHNMGVTLQNMSDYDRALDLFFQALAVYERTPRDPMRISNALKNIATTYSLRGKFEDAIIYFERVLEIETREFGVESLSMADTLSKLGAAYGRIGRFNEAISKCQNALDITRRFRGPWHLDVAIMQYNVGITRLKLGYIKAARSDLVKSHRIYAAVLGEGHFKSRRARELLESVARMRDNGSKHQRKTSLRSVLSRKHSK